MRRKKIPTRTCLGCKDTKPKRELIRIVRTPEGNVIVDPSGKANGRGTYICPTKQCLENALKSKKLEKALEVEISADDLDRLRKELEALLVSS